MIHKARLRRKRRLARAAMLKLSDWPEKWRLVKRRVVEASREFWPGDCSKHGFFHFGGRRYAIDGAGKLTGRCT